jgi:hypothetical protein
VKKTLELINQMQADGVIGKYAIGGAVGATFYLEPAATLDVDIFVLLPQPQHEALLSLTPIYDYLQKRGCTPKGEHIVVEGWPVQFLFPADELDQQAIAEAIGTELEGTPTWVMSAEHLAAIALRTGRAKDQLRLVQFLEQGAVDKSKLQVLIEQFALTAKALQFQKKFSW